MHFSTNTFLDVPASMRGEPSAERMVAVQSALRVGGVPAGLRALNEGVPHRYSGIFKLKGDFLENVHMFDKLGEPRPDSLVTVRLSDSFCQIVLRDGFLLADHTGRDPQLDASPYQNVVVAYHGVPILDNSGELSGTLCHFDLIEQALTDAEFACMQQAARLFAPALSRPD